MHSASAHTGLCTNFMLCSLMRNGVFSCFKCCTKRLKALRWIRILHSSVIEPFQRRVSGHSWFLRRLMFDMRGAQKTQPFGQPLDGRVRRRGGQARRSAPKGRKLRCMRLPIRQWANARQELNVTTRRDRSRLPPSQLRVHVSTAERESR